MAELVDGFGLDLKEWMDGWMDGYVDVEKRIFMPNWRYDTIKVHVNLAWLRECVSIYSSLHDRRFVFLHSSFLLLLLLLFYFIILYLIIRMPIPSYPIPSYPIPFHLSTSSIYICYFLPSFPSFLPSFFVSLPFPSFAFFSFLFILINSFDLF